jgi:hypothetical protein
MNLVVIAEPEHPLLNLVKDDPVRPHIPVNQRVSENSRVFALVKDTDVVSMVCVCFRDTVPTAESDLFGTAGPVAVFYTIWSYTRGAGRDLIEAVNQWLAENRRDIQRCVTLSPKTVMAREFHLRNGATVFRENDESVNYEYC